MTNEDLPKAVHPQVLERIESLFERSLALADAVEGLVKDDLHTAAAQVTYKLVAEMKAFKSEISSLKAKAIEHFKSEIAAAQATQDEIGGLAPEEITINPEPAAPAPAPEQA
jgi:hypothetical protein